MLNGRWVKGKEKVLGEKIKDLRGREIATTGWSMSRNDEGWVQLRPDVGDCNVLSRDARRASLHAKTGGVETAG